MLIILEPHCNQGNLDNFAYIFIITFITNDARPFFSLSAVRAAQTYYNIIHVALIRSTFTTGRAHYSQLISDIHRTYPSKRILTGLYRTTSETPFQWRFTGGPIVARSYMLAWYGRDKIVFRRTLTQASPARTHIQLEQRLWPSQIG